MRSPISRDGLSARRWSALGSGYRHARAWARWPRGRELVFQVPNGQQKNEESIFILWVCAVRESFREKALKLCDLLGERTPHKKLGFSIPQRLTVSVLKNHQVCLKSIEQTSQSPCPRQHS